LEEDLELSVGETETETSVKYLLNIMIEEAVGKNNNETKPNITHYSPTKSKEKNIFKSKEFISSSDDKDIEVPKLREQKRNTILIPAPKKRQCRYIFVKKPKKGERCTNLTLGQFCVIHTKRSVPEKDSVLKKDSTSQRQSTSTNSLSYSSANKS
jgi:hypothetical protein